MHPETFQVITIHGRRTPTPRWQQAYGADYHYTGQTNHALPVPPALRPLLAWGQAEIDQRLNGLLLNWYDPELGHYIGPHRDSRANIILDTPIVTISFGGMRIFRLKPWRRPGQTYAFYTPHGAVYVMPWATNLAWTHEVPRRARDHGRRISVTLRAFESEAGRGRPSDRDDSGRTAVVG